MANPIRALLDRCSIGFPLWQKWLLTGAALVYVVSPIDLIPDVIPVLGWSDDVFFLYVLVRVWRSPTLPTPESGAAAAPVRTVADRSSHAVIPFAGERATASGRREGDVA